MNNPSSSDFPPASGGSSAPRRLRRSRNGKFAGVASGIAEYLGISTKWVRIGFVVGFMFGGAGFFAYVAAWFGLPDQNDQDPRPVRLTGDVGKLVIAAVFGALAVAAVSGGTVALSSSLVLPVLLIGVGYVILNQGPSESEAGTGRATQFPDADPYSAGGAFPKADGPAPIPPAPGPIPPVPSPSSGEQPTADPASQTDPMPVAASPEVADAARETDTQDTREEDERDPLLVEADRLRNAEAWVGTSSLDPFENDPPHWAVTKTEAATATVVKTAKPPIVLATLGFAAAAVGLLAITGQLFGFSTGTAILATMVLFISLAGFFIGRIFKTGWSLLFVALTAAFAIMIAPVIDLTASDGAGDRAIIIRGDDLLQDSYRMGAGDFEVDLREATISQNQTVEIELGAGDLRVQVPDNVRVEVEAVSDFGEAEVAGQFVAGVGNEISTVLQPELDGPVLSILAKTTYGVVAVDNNSRARALVPVPSIGEELLDSVEDLNEVPVGIPVEVPVEVPAVGDLPSIPPIPD